MKAKILTFSLALMFASVLAMNARAQQAAVRVTPASYTVAEVGLTFNVNITIENVENLYGYEFALYYPNGILNGTSVTQGPFLRTGGTPAFFNALTFTDNYNSTHGLLRVMCLRIGNVSGVDGGGTLATITFKSMSTGGPRTLQLADASLSDPNEIPIPFTATDGEVTVVPEFPTALILPLLVVLTLLTIALKKKTEKPIEKSSTSF